MVLEEQGVLGGLADIIIEIYGMESALLRTLKQAETRGEDEAKTSVQSDSVVPRMAMTNASSSSMPSNSLVS